MLGLEPLTLDLECTIEGLGDEHFRWFGGCNCPSITNPHLDSLHHDFCTHKTMMAVTFVQMDKDMAVESVTPLLGLSAVISYVLSLCLSLIGSASPGL